MLPLFPLSSYSLQHFQFHRRHLAGFSCRAPAPIARGSRSGFRFSHHHLLLAVAVAVTGGVHFLVRLLLRLLVVIVCGFILLLLVAAEAA